MAEDDDERRVGQPRRKKRIWEVARGGRGVLPPTRGRRGLVPPGRRNGDGAPIAHRPGLPSLWLSLRRIFFLLFKERRLPPPLVVVLWFPLGPAVEKECLALGPDCVDLNLTVRHGVCPPPRLCPAVSSCPLYLVAPLPAPLAFPLFRCLCFPPIDSIDPPPTESSRFSNSDFFIFIIIIYFLPLEKSGSA